MPDIVALATTGRLAEFRTANIWKDWRRTSVLPGLSLQRMYELALEVPQFAEGGIGVYDENFLHVDVRDRQARWARVSGEYVGIAELVSEPQLLAQEGSAITPG
jgi:hypothetical protein